MVKATNYIWNIFEKFFEAEGLSKIEIKKLERDSSFIKDEKELKVWLTDQLGYIRKEKAELKFKRELRKHIREWREKLAKGDFSNPREFFNEEELKALDKSVEKLYWEYYYKKEKTIRELLLSWRKSTHLHNS